MVSGFLAGAAGGATVAIVIKAVDQFSRTLTKAEKQMAALGTAMTAVGLAGAFAIGGLLKLSGQLEQNRIAFTTMLGSAEEADKLLRDLSDFASKTPFTIPGIRQNAKMLLAMGTELDEMIPTLKFLGDVSSGLSVPLERLALNFGQVRVQGRLTGRELRDFSVAGVPLVAELAKNLNKSEAAIKDMVSAGKIGFDDVEKAFKTMTGEGGKFFDLMDEQSESFFGQISNIADSLIQFGEVMGNIFLPIAKKVAGALQVLVGWFEEHPTIATFAAVLLAVSTALLLIAGPILVLIAMLPALIAGFGTLSAVTLPITGTVLAITLGIIALTAAFVFLFKKWDELGPKTKILLGFLMPFIAIPVAIIKNWDKLKIGMAEIWNSIVTSVGKGVNGVINAVNWMIKQINKVIDKTGGDKLGLIGGFSVEGGLINIDAMKKVTEEIEKQVDATKNLTKEQQLVNQLSGFLVLPTTGDIFNPGAFQKSEFESKFGFEQAKRGAGVEINIENINGMDPDEIAAAIQNKLRNATTI